jgi:Asp-tRNA(Asn)/Glu-tRNA(Gln) amidotransferase A subunit family amidase
MDTGFGSIAALRAAYARGDAKPGTVLEEAMQRANSNAGGNVYLEMQSEWSRAEAARLRREEMEWKPLWGVPVSLKDCFELGGFGTSCGSKFYREQNGVASEDSAVATKLRAAGAVIVGKTHLHQLAYGITGESRDYGDCLQPLDARRLTGGSSSGAAASVQEGSAMAAIGTDTGGSIRVPAALCGLTGYRSSVTMQEGLWRGGAHLAESFDTVGWLYRELADGPVLARVLLDLPEAVAPSLVGLRVGVPRAEFLHDCEADVLALQCAWQAELAERGANVVEFDAEWWEGATGVFAPIQANEAAALHRGNFEHFEAAIAERLGWGAGTSNEEMVVLRGKLAEFRARMGELMQRFDVLLLPCCPVAALEAGVDHSQTRVRLLRYTAPISVAGMPVVALPGGRGGLQLVGRLGDDAKLLALSVRLGEFSLRG